MSQVSELSPDLTRGLLHTVRALLAAVRSSAPPEHPTVRTGRTLGLRYSRLEPNLCTMIVSIADVFDALRSDRPHLEGLASVSHTPHHG